MTPKSSEFTRAVVSPAYWPWTQLIPTRFWGRSPVDELSHERAPIHVERRCARVGVGIDFYIFPMSATSLLFSSRRIFHFTRRRGERTGQADNPSTPCQEPGTDTLFLTTAGGSVAARQLGLVPLRPGDCKRPAKKRRGTLGISGLRGGIPFAQRPLPNTWFSTFGIFDVCLRRACT